MLSDKLRKLRKKRHLQQKDLIEYLNVAKSTYSQYESGKSNPDYDTLKKLANFYDVSVDYLLDNDTFIQNNNRLVIKIGNGVELHFRNPEKQLSLEQIKMLKRFYKSITEDEIE